MKLWVIKTYLDYMIRAFHILLTVSYRGLG